MSYENAIVALGCVAIIQGVLLIWLGVQRLLAVRVARRTVREGRRQKVTGAARPAVDRRAGPVKAAERVAQREDGRAA